MEENVLLVTKKPTIWVTHLAKGCPQQAQWLYMKKPKTAVLSPYLAEPHTKAQEKLQMFFEKKGWKAEKEKLLMVETEECILGHYYDLYATHEKEQLFVEIKPEDKTYYEEQYLYAMLLLHWKNIHAKYIVYEYNFQRFVPKQISNTVKIEEMVGKKIEAIFSSNPVRSPSKGCMYCPYSECGHHPQHKEQSAIIDQIIQELENLVK